MAHEYEQAVHEECYVSKLRNETGIACVPPGKEEPKNVMT
jgi:hypothetical protein